MSDEAEAPAGAHSIQAGTVTAAAAGLDDRRQKAIRR